MVVFASNDYLGLAGEDLATEPSGLAGAGASRLVTGSHTEHAALERELAEWQNCSAALLFNSGYNANTGVFSALFDARDVIFSDALNHASLIDGLRLSKARRVVYPHGDVDTLRLRLQEAGADRHRVIVTESIFSMDGDRAPLGSLAALAEEFGALLVVDEAHAIGVFGREGSGLVDALGLDAAVAIRIGTCGKALGTYGAFVAGSSALREVLYNRARSFVYTTALPPAVVQQTRRSLTRVRGGRLQDALWERIAQIGEILNRYALDTSAADSAIFPILVGSAEAALQATHQLRKGGVLITAIRPPTVPTGTARLRLTASAAHTAADLAQLDTALCAWVTKTTQG